MNSPIPPISPVSIVCEIQTNTQRTAYQRINIGGPAHSHRLHSTRTTCRSQITHQQHGIFRIINAKRQLAERRRALFLQLRAEFFQTDVAWLCLPQLVTFLFALLASTLQFCEPSCNLTVCVCASRQLTIPGIRHTYVIRTRAAARVHRKLESKRQQQQQPPHQKCERKKNVENS